MRRGKHVTPTAVTRWSLLLLALACPVVCAIHGDARAMGAAAAYSQLVGPLQYTTSDTSTHTFANPVLGGSGHAVHVSIDWVCDEAGLAGNAGGGRFDGACTDSSGTVTCSSSTGTVQSMTTGPGPICNTPTLAAGSGDAYTIAFSATTASAINRQVAQTLNTD